MFDTIDRRSAWNINKMALASALPAIACLTVLA
jgi:hypothetical protein